MVAVESVDAVDAVNGLVADGMARPLAERTARLMVAIAKSEAASRDDITALGDRIEALTRMVERGFDAVNHRFDEVEHKFNVNAASMRVLDMKINNQSTQTETRLVAMEQCIKNNSESLAYRLDKTDGRIETTMFKTFLWLTGAIGATGAVVFGLATRLFVAKGATP